MSNDNSDDYRKRLADLASDERVSEIESQVFLDISVIEEGAYRVAQIAEGISAIFERSASNNLN